MDKLEEFHNRRSVGGGCDVPLEPLAFELISYMMIAKIVAVSYNRILCDTRVQK